MNCRLCNNDRTVLESHIVPKFVYRWMKKTVTDRLRQSKNFNIPLQDGIKDYILCKECELRFSKKEKWFSENVFLPYLKNEKTIEYNSNLHYFIISLLWRVLVHFKNDGNDYFYKELLDKAEIEWRNYLLDGKDIHSFPAFYLLMIPEEIENVYSIKNFYKYLFRSVDIEIAQSESKCFIYGLIPRFIFIGNIVGLDEKNFEGLKINSLNGVISNKFYVKDSDIMNFIISRISEMKNYEDLSAKQKEIINERTTQNIDRFKNSDYWRIIKKDNYSA